MNLEETKSVVSTAIERRADARLREMDKRILELCAQYLPHERHSFGSGVAYLRDGFSVLTNYDKDMKEKLLKHFIKEEEDKFLSLAGALSSYLENQEH